MLYKNNMVNNSDQKHLVSLDLFNSLEPKIRERLMQILHYRKFKAGEIIYDQGMPAQAIYFVQKGQIKIVRVTKEGYESVLCVRGLGDVFCPVPILDRGPQLGTAIALSDTTISWAEQEVFLALCEESSDLRAFIQTDCLGEVRRLLHRMEAFSFRSVRERLAFTMVDILQKQATKGEAENELRLKQQELAGLVGASRESVSRALAEFQREGIVTLYRGRILVHQFDQLKALAEE